MKAYEEPIIVISEIKTSDIITTSIGDTPYVEFDW